jgi:hypothetical protein
VTESACFTTFFYSNYTTCIENNIEKFCTAASYCAKDNALLWFPSTQFVYGTNTPHVSLHDMFRPDGAIFRYIWVFVISFFLVLLSPHWPAFTHWECVVCMVFGKIYYKQQLSETQEQAVEIHKNTVALTEPCMHITSTSYVALCVSLNMSLAIMDATSF